MNSNPTKAEKNHLARVKNLPCGVCDAFSPSEAHHILDTGRMVGQYITIPLCRDCHSTVPNGAMWKIYKKTELQILNETIRRLYG